ncbi:MAG TPA: Nramp family divalent metal transporter [Solirubrobacterales bacterium]|jgi:Mn2+/Fe2+ NRAMP family transporter|nr:Nramp family divalent metal transporter [Solirubrobacterales bacterium]
MKKLFGVALGIMAAMGGFVDIGDLVFNTQVGARFGYQMIWVVVIGVIGIIVFSEMCGRVVAVSGRPVFDIVRDRFGYRTGLFALIASELLILLTLAAELGGVALVLQLLTATPLSLAVIIGLISVVLVIWLTSFETLERVFGYVGLFLIVYVVAAVTLGPDWNQLAQGFVPSIRGGQDTLPYLYFGVGLIAAAMTPYEVYFFSSGGVEERWTTKDLGLNRANAIAGYGLGGVLSIALIATTAQVFEPVGIEPESIGSVALAAQIPLGHLGFLAACLGMMFAIGGATVDTALSGAYNLGQFFGWDWGRYRPPAEASRFTVAWLAFFTLATVIALTGVDAVKLTEYAVLFSVVALPFTYLPILLVARDESYMGDYRNGIFANVVGWAYFALLMVISVVALPLMILTNMGQS